MRTLSNGKINVSIPILMLAFAVLACAGPVKMGELVPGSPPLVFTMKGEVDHTWDVVVTPEAQYRLVLEKLATDHPMNWIEIHIRYGDQYISSPVNLSGDRATIDFVGPQSGQINIVVYSLIGEGREDLGTFTIQILEIEPRVEIEGR